MSKIISRFLLVCNQFSVRGVVLTLGALVFIWGFTPGVILAGPSEEHSGLSIGTEIASLAEEADLSRSEDETFEEDSHDVGDSNHDGVENDHEDGDVSNHDAVENDHDNGDVSNHDAVENDHDNGDVSNHDAIDSDHDGGSESNGNDTGDHK